MRKDLIVEWLTQKGHALDTAMYTMLEKYQAMVLSAPFNLTAIKTSEDFAVKHFIDSLTLLPYINGDARCIDIGTGAGFPGIPVAIAKPGLNLTLLDSLKKRILFLRHAVDELGLQNIECVHTRAEDWAEQNRASYDIGLARAVAPLGKLVSYALPLVVQGGKLLAMKGPDVTFEIEDAMPMLEKYQGEVEAVDKVEISNGMIHTIITVRKR